MKKFRWYRPEYKKVDRICLWGLITCWFIALGIAAQQELAPALFSENMERVIVILACIFMTALFAVDLAIVYVDKHERKLSEGKIKAQGRR